MWTKTKSQKISYSKVFIIAAYAFLLLACMMEIKAEGYASSHNSYRSAIRAIESAEDAADRLLNYARDDRLTYSAESTLESRLENVCDGLEDLSEDDLSRTEYRALERAVESLSDKTYATLRYMGYETYSAKYSRFDRKLDRIERALRHLM